MSAIDAAMCAQIIGNRLWLNREEIDRLISRQDGWQFLLKHPSGVTLQVAIDASKRKEVSSDDEKEAGETTEAR